MNNGDMPINATSPNKHQPEWAAARVGGLTKREYFAGLAMQGMLSSSDYATSTWNTVAIEAVEVADALLKELEK
jgi:hypothetical protein